MDDDDQPVTNLMSAAAGRPALVPYLNVEMIIALQVCGAGAMIAQIANIFYGAIFAIVVLLFCRIMTMIDDQAFRILGIQIRMHLMQMNWQFWKPITYTSNKPRF